MAKRMQGVMHYGLNSLLKFSNTKPSTVVHTHDFGVQKAEAGELWIQGWCRLHNETPSQKICFFKFLIQVRD